MTIKNLKLFKNISQIILTNKSSKNLKSINFSSHFSSKVQRTFCPSPHIFPSFKKKGLKKKKNFIAMKPYVSHLLALQRLFSTYFFFHSKAVHTHSMRCRKCKHTNFLFPLFTQHNATRGCKNVDAQQINVMNAREGGKRKDVFRR